MKISVKPISKIIAAGIMLCSIFLNFSCENKPKAVLAKVGTAKLSKTELMAQLPDEFRITRENLPALLDKWVNSELIYQEALRRKLDQNERIQLQIKQLAKEYIINQLLEQEAEKMQATSSEMLAYFNKHKEDFLYEVKIRRIVLPSFEFAAATLNELKAGADFAQLAKERSIEQTPERGEPSRFFARGIAEPNLEEAIFALKPGETSDVLKGSEGYQIIRLVDKKQVKKDISFAEVADYIEQIISYQKSRVHLDSIINDLRAKGKFQVFPEVYFSTQE